MTFSVLIPCHNPRADWLEHALHYSMLQLDFLRDEIIVVDDCSNNGSEIQALAEKYHASYLRNDSEQGGVKSHNMAIRAATKDLIAVVHPDDFVLPGFYDLMRATMERNPNVALSACETILVREDGVPIGLATHDWTETHKIQDIHFRNPLYVPSVVVRHAAYEKHGLWDERLIHCSDWECWLRMRYMGGAVWVRRPLACYRDHASNHTGRLARTAENMRDYLRMGKVVEEYCPVDWPKFSAAVMSWCQRQAQLFREDGDLEAARCSQALVDELSWQEG